MIHVTVRSEENLSHCYLVQSCGIGVVQRDIEEIFAPNVSVFSASDTSFHSSTVDTIQP